MNSQEDEMRCRCAYNTSLNTQREMTGDCGGRKTAAEACAPTVKCCTASAAAVPCVDPCAKPCVDPCAKPCVDPCAKPCVDPCAKPCVRPNTRCGEKPAAPCYDSVRPPCAAATKECEKPKSCNGNDRAGVMNICEKPRTCYEFTRPCSRPDDCERPRSCNPNICTRLDDGCGSFDLTPYGQQFAICTKRVIKKCACVKFNGLQDTCKHPDCCIRRGCLDKPFPTCPPARKWRFTNVCCRDKMKKKCKPDCN